MIVYPLLLLPPYDAYRISTNEERYRKTLLVPVNEIYSRGRRASSPYFLPLSLSLSLCVSVFISETEQEEEEEEGNEKGGRAVGRQAGRQAGPGSGEEGNAFGGTVEREASFPGEAIGSRIERRVSERFRKGRSKRRGWVGG